MIVKKKAEAAAAAFLEIWEEQEIVTNDKESNKDGNLICDFEDQVEVQMTNPNGCSRD